MSSFVVGVTGGIGSGKSAVAERFAALGIDVIDADLASRAILQPGQPALAAIAEHFGCTVMNDDGTLDRAALRARVFADAAERRWLERLTHPLIGAWLRAQLAAARSPYCLLVNPLLIESGNAHGCRRILVVDAPEDVQLERTVARDGNTPAQVQAIMSAQATRTERLAQADDVIVNDSDLAHLDQAVRTLHEKYLELSGA
ncbi:MAG: dephospho-CoA kinase [Pseudomonadales bacterium]